VSAPPLQLVIPGIDFDVREAGEIVAAEAAVRAQGRLLHDRSAGAGRPRPCRCERPWLFKEGHCVRCGREVAPAS
jgi:hypothetical protein